MMASAMTTEVFCIRSRAASGRMIAFAMAACSSPSCRTDENLGGCGFLLELADELVGFERFMVNLVERRNAIVPLQQRGGVADQFDGAGIEFPDGVQHRMIVGVENVFFEFGMARDVDLRDAVVRDIIDVI